ncbi:MAG: SoxR reducing system RseC family protein [Roseburia sp.]|nr:SoxR reducing system RseC family protein [Roseburia sp.]
MTERCIIKKRKRGVAYIEIERKDSCGGCNICSFNNKKSIVVPAVCEIEASVGQYVNVEMPTRSVGAASLLIYALPLLLCVIGAVCGYLCGEWWLQPVLAAVGLAIGIACAVCVDRAYRKRSGVLPKVVAIADTGADVAQTHYDEKAVKGE